MPLTLQDVVGSQVLARVDALAAQLASDEAVAGIDRAGLLKRYVALYLTQNPYANVDASLFASWTDNQLRAALGLPTV